jgi:hypothetical protein
MNFSCGCVGEQPASGICDFELYSFSSSAAQLNGLFVFMADPVAKRTDYFEDVSASFALQHNGPKLIGRYTSSLTRSSIRTVHLTAGNASVPNNDWHCSNPLHRYSWLVESHRPLPPSAYLEAELENPEDKERPIVARAVEIKDDNRHPNTRHVLLLGQRTPRARRCGLCY